MKEEMTRPTKTAGNFPGETWVTVTRDVLLSPSPLTDTDIDTEEDTDTGEETTDKKPKKAKKEKKDRKTKKTGSGDGEESDKARKKRLKNGFDLIPPEEDEAANPAIALYNEIGRHIANFDASEFPVKELSAAQVSSVYYAVICDYPEFFWTEGYRYCRMGDRVVKMELTFRCLLPDGTVDQKTVQSHRKELKKAAAPFLKGITRKTGQYQAMLTIYRRLILTLDYDSVGLEAHVDANRAKEDPLRSLHSALVDHKVVCAGYAVAMQYLLQAVGITSAYVCSEVKNGSGHAFNIVKIGKECYYLDATWGDSSNTKGNRKDQTIGYDYFCVPYEEFLQTSPDTRYNHIPSQSAYPYREVREYSSKRYEYYRYHGYYLDSYDVDALAKIFAKQATDYRKEDMGDFTLSFRTGSPEGAAYIVNRLRTGELAQVLDKARTLVGKDKAAIARLRFDSYSTFFKATSVGTIRPEYKG